MLTVITSFGHIAGGIYNNLLRKSIFFKVNTSRARNPECLVSCWLRNRSSANEVPHLPSQDEKLGGPVKEVSFSVYAYLHYQQISNYLVTGISCEVVYRDDTSSSAHREDGMASVLWFSRRTKMLICS